MRAKVAVRSGGVRIADGRVTGGENKRSREETADFYVLAVPHQAVAELLPADLVDREPMFANLQHLRSSPITGVHFWFDRDVMADPFLTLLDRTTQWIFNKSILSGGPGGGRYLQLVISASYALVSRSRGRKFSISACANCTKSCPTRAKPISSMPR